MIGLITPTIADHQPISAPITTLQRLQAAQDALANGDVNALSLQARLLSELGAQLAHTSLDFFREGKHFYIVLLYLVHGGNPEQVHHLFEKPLPAGVNEKLVEAVVAYAQGREGDFHAALSGGATELDDANWPTALRASIYLALTPYIARKDLALADKRLDYIRLVAPGSLYEETALRRQVKIAATLKDEKKLGLLVRHYAARFSNSPYMRDFWAEVAEALALSKDNLSQPIMDRLLIQMPENLRYPTYLRLARLALIDARLEQAAAYAGAAQQLAAVQNLDDHVARFYQLAAKAPTLEADMVKEPLQAIDLEMIPLRDRALVVAARNIADSITANSSETQTIVDEEPDAHPDERIDNLLAPVQQRLDEIDALLENEK